MLYDNSVTKCQLSGNLCSSLCPEVSGICANKKIEGRFITVGQLYFLYKINQTAKYEDREFIVYLVSGKSLFSETDKDEFMYDPIRLMENKSFSKYMVPFDITEDDAAIHKKIVELIERIKKPEREARKKLVEESIAIHDGVPPQQIKTILAELSKPIEISNYYAYHEYTNLIFDYILGKLSLTNDELRIIIVYLICSYIPKNKDDFPTNLLRIDESRINKIIEKTRNLPETDPTKWSKERLLLLKSLDSIYRQLVIFDNHLYLWKIYTLPSVSIEDLTDFDIQAKYLLDLVLNKFSFIHSSLYVVVNYYQESQYLVKLHHVVKLIFELISSRKEFLLKNRASFFTDEMLKRQYVLIKEASYGQIQVDVAKNLKVTHPSLVEIFKYLEKEQLIKEYKLI